MTKLAISIPLLDFSRFLKFIEKSTWLILLFGLSVLSILNFNTYYQNQLGIAYNDSRSHLDIGRRVVEGLKPGLAQIGSVWLPLPHLLMVPTIWNDFMWHSGLSGAIPNMIAFVATGLLIYAYLGKLKVGWLGRIVAVVIFAANLNILYLQSTAMTELLLIGTMMAGGYYLLVWAQDDQVLNLIKAAAWVMLATLIRYDGWFLMIMAAGLIGLKVLVTRGYKVSEGTVILFSTLAGFGIVMWFLWNLLIFKDPLYFALGPFSAHSQQEQLNAAGILATKGNLLLSIQMYLYAAVYNSTAFIALLGAIGAIALWMDRRLAWTSRLAALALAAPILFNILALFLGHSVLFVQGLSGNTWFNIRYGIMVLPTFAIGIGYLVDRLKAVRWTLIGVLAFTIFFSYSSADAVTIDDASVGSSQKNVSDVANYLSGNAADKTGFILISVASHDAIIFSSGLPMKRFIHEGTGAYWESATTSPDRWARWIVMRTYDLNDLTWKATSNSVGLQRFTLVGKYPFADIYELKPEYLPDLTTEPVFGRQK